MLRRSLIAILAAGLLGLCAVPAARAGLQANQVLVVVNDSSSLSTAIGAYYASRRGIPAVNVCHLPGGTTTQETILRSTYNTQVRDRLITYLTQTHPQLRSQIKAIVLTKGVPLRILNSAGSGIWQNCASVDSELTQLFTGNVPDGGQLGWVLNPYFDVPRPFDAFSHPDLSYLVFRLDGYQSDVDPGSGVPGDIKQLIDSAWNPATAGQFVLDAQTNWADGDNWMVEAGAKLGQMGLNAYLDTSMAQFVSDRTGILGYCSWGSNDPSNPGVPFYGEVPPGGGHVYPGTFLPGSVATTYVSSSARTFLEGSQNYGQSLIADLIHLGVTAANGHVFEPYLNSVARPHILFRRYTEGFSIGEAFYQSMAFISWENVVVCDPLMRSGVSGAIPPRIDSVTPSSASHTGATQVTIHGADFTTPYDTVVRVGGKVCSIVMMPDSSTITIQVPAGDPGWASLEVETPFGSDSHPFGFVYSPALTLQGQASLGSSITFQIWGEPLQSYVVLWGQAPGVLAFPPHGVFRLDPSHGLGPLFGGSLSQVPKEIPFVIPGDPTFAGLTLYLQAAIGDDLAAGDGYLSNLVTLAIGSG